MAGELWRVQAQMGKEVTSGTGVAATRKAYLEDCTVMRERDADLFRPATGTRDNARAQTLGPVRAGGSATLRMSADELNEWFAIGIQGGVTPTTPGGGTTTRLWTFKPSLTLDSMTLEYDDGAIARRLLGTRVNSYHFTGSVNGDNNVELDLFGTDLATNALTGALAARVPTFTRKWEVKAYIDNFAGTPGTTPLLGVTNWDITINNNMDRFYAANNTLAADRVTIGQLDVTARITIDATQAQAASEYANWNSETYRILRLEFGNNDIIEAALTRFVTIDIPGAWNAVNLGSSVGNIRAYELSMNGIYEPTLATQLQIRTQSTRTTLF